MQKKIPGIRTMVVDDEQAALEGVANLLSKDSEIDIVALCTGGEVAITRIEDLHPELLFIDIQMPMLTGFDVLNNINTGKMPVTVFVTAYDQYALKAFEVNAVDYLLKPFNDRRFYQTLEKAKMQVRQMKSFEIQQKMMQMLVSLDRPDLMRQVGSASGYPCRIFIKDSKGINFVNTEDIKWILADDYYLTIYTREKKHLLRETMNNIEGKLDPASFIRISRSVIVHINQIKSIEHYSKTEHLLLTVSGEKFKTSLSRFKQIKDKFSL
jgi:two-component system LytT family response regulator